MRTSLPPLLAVAITAWMTGAALPARADTPTEPSPEAVAAFDEGRRLLDAHDYPGAIAKFEQSVRATRTVGALLNLGRAYEESGRLASAWATFRAAASLAREMHDHREGDGDRLAAAIVGRVSHLTIDGRAVEGVPGVAVTCDDAPAARGEPIPVDAGKHVVTGNAPGKLPWTTTVEVRPDGATATVVIGPLEDAPASAAPTASAPATAPEPPPPSSKQRIAGFVLGGVGVASIGAGVVLGSMAMSKHSAAVSACPSYPDHCPSSGAADGPNHDAQTFATVSTVTFIAGAAAAAVGAVLVLTAPRAVVPAGAVRVTPLLGLRSLGAGAEVAW